MNWPTPRTSARIARIECLRSRRAISTSPIQLLGVALFALLFVGGPTIGGSYVAYRFAGSIIDAVPVLGVVRGSLALVWLVSTVLIAQRAVGKTGRIDNEAGLLTTVPASDVVGGLVLAEFARLVSVVAVPLLAVSAALSVGLRAPAAFLSVVSALFALLATALLVGHLVGLVLKTLFARSELLTRYRSVLAVVGFLVYFAAVSSQAFGRLLGRLFVLLQDAPMAWFGDLLVLGIPGVDPSPIRIAGATALFAVGVPLLVALDVRAATGLWYTDGPRPTVRKRAPSGSNAAFLSRIASGPTRTVTATIWSRTARTPFRLVYVAYPLLFLFVPLRGAVTSGQVPGSLPVLVALYGTWAIGAAALNPLGDEGPMLPLTLTSTVRGSQFVGGHVLSVTAVGLPVLVALTAIAGALSPLEPTVWVLLTAVSALLSVTGPIVAVAIGTVFPRFGTVRITHNRRVVVPSKRAFVYYTLVVAMGFVGAAVALVPGGATLVSNAIAFWSTLLVSPVELAPATLRLVGGVVAVSLGAVVPPVAYRYVVRRFDTYTLA
ncbi:hypothetical protein [Halalkalicoccus jeotgali]|uniref:ABC-2 type transport system permease protein n=1 Tax=Halalkalicoccus jeotgali (strain DSM 18796 / CECT 7217 / JCM 14584 / KCTC 4019 / B3) TaxID=795797 RepID=D8J7P1_HALJB|nr:hypothetical protein [Halalkalicoccus jeotgali]ADJ16061.1 hypothetical protein HacjB3_13400 [Halalkalicoccus jeotgali B3]ELY38157.1 hypothetical protein C497_08604 [Halalkalicoccus jeotgali B3]